MTRVVRIADVHARDASRPRRSPSPVAGCPLPLPLPLPLPRCRCRRRCRCRGGSCGAGRSPLGGGVGVLALALPFADCPLPLPFAVAIALVAGPSATAVSVSAPSSALLAAVGAGPLRRRFRRGWRRRVAAWRGRPRRPWPRGCPRRTRRTVGVAVVSDWFGVVVGVLLAAVGAGCLGHDVAAVGGVGWQRGAGRLRRPWPRGCPRRTRSRRAGRLSATASEVSWASADVASSEVGGAASADSVDESSVDESSPGTTLPSSLSCSESDVTRERARSAAAVKTPGPAAARPPTPRLATVTTAMATPRRARHPDLAGAVPRTSSIAVSAASSPTCSAGRAGDRRAAISASVV